MLIYCICTKYLVGAHFALITASIQRGMEVISLWHCWGGMEAQDSLAVAFSSSAFFGLLFLILLLTILHILYYLWGSGLVSLLASQAHQHHGHLTNFWCSGSVDRCQILLENEISIFKKLVSRKKHEVLQNVLVNGCSDVGFQKTQWTNTSRWHLSSHITLQPKTDCPLKLSRVEPGQYLDGRPPGKTRLLLEEVLVRPVGGAHPAVCVGLNAPI